MEKSFGLYFHLKKSKNELEFEMSIYLKVTVNGMFCEVSTKRKCEPSKWNVGAGRVEGKTEAAKSINSYLDVLQRKVYDYRKQLFDDDKPLTAENIKMLLQGQGINRPKHLLMDIFRQHNDQIRALVGREYAAGTLERYETSYKHTLNFLQWKYKMTDIDITKLNYEFMAEYEFWLKSVRKCDHNSTMKYLANFKKIVIRCIKNGWLCKRPLFRYSLRLEFSKLRAFCYSALSTKRLISILWDFHSPFVDKGHFIAGRWPFAQRTLLATDILALYVAVLRCNQRAILLP
jgi:hypothetical protein